MRTVLALPTFLSEKAPDNVLVLSVTVSPAITPDVVIVPTFSVAAVVASYTLFWAVMPLTVMIAGVIVCEPFVTPTV